MQEDLQTLINAPDGYDTRKLCPNDSNVYLESIEN
jgi:hypothetical protein